MDKQLRQKRVRINVSGAIFETYNATLERYPTTLLGDSEKRLLYYRETENEYYFNRDRKCFEAILYFYQSFGRLSRPADVGLKRFEGECDFFQLPETSICCMRFKEGAILTDTIQARLSKKIIPTTNRRMQLWHFLEYPQSSFWARIFAYLSFFAIFSSVVAGAIETMPEIKQNGLIGAKRWYYIEFGLNWFFLLELTLRLIAAPDKIAFLKNLINWLDIITVVPYFIQMTAPKSLLQPIKFLRFLRVLLLFFRISKQSAGLTTIIAVLEDSLKDLQLFLVYFMIVIIFGGTFIYFFEKNNETGFSSILEGLWWAEQTFLTVGYGDLVPGSKLGRLFASFFMATGVATIALPVFTILNRFVICYNLYKET